MITLVLPKDAVQAALEHAPIAFVVSICGAPCDLPETEPEWLAGLTIPKLLLRFDDIEEQVNAAGYIGPRFHDIAALVAFTRALPTAGMGIVHCAAGISRSTAAAIVMHATKAATDPVLAMLDGVAHACTAGLRDDGFVLPNRRVVELGETALARADLLRLVEARFRGRYEGSPYSRCA